jgi:hypothetical protein
MIPFVNRNRISRTVFLGIFSKRLISVCDAIVSLDVGVAKSDVYSVKDTSPRNSHLSFILYTFITMDVTTPIRPNDLFSAKGLVVVITGGGSGTLLKLRATPPSPAPLRLDMLALNAQINRSLQSKVSV